MHERSVQKKKKCTQKGFTQHHSSCRRSGAACPTARRGFTLIEVIVAIGLFSVLVTIAVGGLTRALRTQREVTALIATNSNASLAFEQLARELRVAEPAFFTEPVSDPTRCDGDELVLTTLHDSLVTYRRCHDDQHTHSWVEREANGGTPQKITSDNVDVRFLGFTLVPAALPARVTVTLEVAPSANDPAIKDDVIDLQTTIAPRKP